MSERGSFVTDYMYCDQCFEAAKGVLLSRHKYLCSVVIPHWDTGADKPREFPIIAGKVGGLYRGEELDTFEQELVPKLESVLCHSLRIAVLAESGKKIFTVTPTDTAGPDPAGPDSPP